MALLIIPVLKCDRELDVRTATYGPGIDQSQHAKSCSQPYNKWSYRLPLAHIWDVLIQIQSFYFTLIIQYWKNIA